MTIKGFSPSRNSQNTLSQPHTERSKIFGPGFYTITSLFLIDNACKFSLLLLNILRSCFLDKSSMVETLNPRLVRMFGYQIIYSWFTNLLPMANDGSNILITFPSLATGTVTTFRILHTSSMHAEKRVGWWWWILMTQWKTLRPWTTSAWELVKIWMMGIPTTEILWKMEGLGRWGTTLNGICVAGAGEVMVARQQILWVNKANLMTLWTREAPDQITGGTYPKEEAALRASLRQVILQTRVETLPLMTNR